MLIPVQLPKHIKQESGKIVVETSLDVFNPLEFGFDDFLTYVRFHPIELKVGDKTIQCALYKDTEYTQSIRIYFPENVAPIVVIILQVYSDLSLLDLVKEKLFLHLKLNKQCLEKQQAINLLTKTLHLLSSSITDK